MNAIKQTIKSGKTAIGTTAGPNIDVSVLADAGFDFILFDTQHSPYEIKQMAPSIQAMRGKKAAPLVRVAANQADQICFALDAGARGIIAPMINTRAEAEAMVRSCRYYPLGNRSDAGVPVGPAACADHHAAPEVAPVVVHRGRPGQRELDGCHGAALTRHRAAR